MYSDAKCTMYNYEQKRYSNQGGCNNDDDYYTTDLNDDVINLR